MASNASAKLMSKVYGYYPLGFAALGVGLACLHPYPGALIALGSLAAGVTGRWLEAVEVKAAKELIHPLGQVVNANAAKLEAAVIDLDNLKNTFALIQGQKQLGIR